MSTRILSARCNATNVRRRNLPFALTAALAASFGAHAADIVVQPAAGSGFVVKDASGAHERLRVQETGAVTLPGVAAAPAQTQALCASAGGQLGPCSAGMATSYSAGTGLALAGTAFSVAPTYQLPQGCTANQVAQWNGSAWNCGSAGGGTLPAGTVNQTLRYDASNKLVANDLLHAFDDGGLVAGGSYGTGNIPATGAGTRMMWYPAKAAFRAGAVDGAQWDDANVGSGSVAMGVSTTAIGNFSTAMGYGTTASSDYASTAMGYKTTASGRYGSTAMGFQTKASGKTSTAMGESTTASANDSTAMGRGSIANGETSTAMGDSTTASGYDSTAMGYKTIASGQFSTAMGNQTTATGYGSTAMGNNTTASGDSSVAMGNNTIASGDYSTAMGVRTTATGYGSTAMGILTKATGNNSTAMGTNADTLNLSGSFVYGDKSHDGVIVSSAPDQFMVVASGGFIFYTSHDYSSGLQLAKNNSSWTTLSDRNAKTAVQPVNAREVLDKVVAMPLNTWQYKAQEAKYRHMGPMAQDFYAAFQLGESNTGIDTVDADGVALAAIQGLHAELTEKNREMTMRLKDKDAEIATLRAESAAQAQNHDVQIAMLCKEKDREVAALRAELSTQKTRVATLESLAGEVAEMKAQLTALRSRSMPAAVSVALEP